MQGRLTAHLCDLMCAGGRASTLGTADENTTPYSGFQAWEHPTARCLIQQARKERKYTATACSTRELPNTGYHMQLHS